MNPLVLALASYVCWGSGDVFGTITSRKLGAYNATLWTNIASVLLFSAYIPFALKDLADFSWILLGYSLLLGVIFFIGEVAFNEATRSSNASLAGTIAASYSAVTVLLSVLLYKEQIGAAQVIPILIILCGVVLCTLDFSDLRKANVGNKGTSLAVVAMLCWGAYFALLKPIVSKIGPFWPTYFAFLLIPLLYAFMRRRKIKTVSPLLHKAVLPLLVTALLLRGGDIIFNAAIRSGETSTVAPIAGSYPTLFVLLAFLVFRDPINRQQKIGLAVALLGIVALSYATAT